MNLFKKILFSGSLALFLTACGSTPVATQYYQLPDSAFRLPEKNAVAIGVQVQLSEFLKNNNMLYQTDAHTLNFAQNNLWSAPLDEAIAAAISNKLNRQSSLKYLPAHANQKTGLTLYINRFQGRYTGETEISGYAQWQNGQQRPFYAITPQHGDGYAAMVESLDKGLDEVARQIGHGL